MGKVIIYWLGANTSDNIDISVNGNLCSSINANVPHTVVLEDINLDDKLKFSMGSVKCTQKVKNMRYLCFNLEYDNIHNSLKCYNVKKHKDDMSVSDNLGEWFDRNVSSVIFTILFIVGIGIVGGIVYGGYKFFGFDKEEYLSNNNPPQPDISYWNGTWSTPEGIMEYTFNSATMKVHVRLLNGVEYDKDYAMIPDGSGVCFYDYSGESVSIVNKDGELYRKNLTTGVVTEVGIKLIHK